MIYNLKGCILFLLIIGFCAGCGTQNQSTSQLIISKPISQSVANEAKENVINKDEVSDVRAVNTDKELLVAVKVKQFDRFQLKKIEKNVKSDLTKLYPDHKILVSTDQKMYFELDKLEEELQKEKIDMKKLEKDIKKIKNLMKEQT